jgi:GNAT superfamily N-acetyltransferase
MAKDAADAALPHPAADSGPSPAIATRAALAEWIERSALLDLFAAAPPALRAELGLFVERAPGLSAFCAPGVASLMLNRVFLDAGAPLAIYAALPGTLEVLRARSVTTPLVHAHLDDDADPRADALRRAGLIPFRRPWLKLAREAGPLAEPTPRLPIELCRADEAEAFAALASDGLGLTPGAVALLATLVQRPRWHVYVARDRGVPVATGALFVQGEVGYLGYAATRPSHRGLGLQRALIARRLRVANALGCTLVASETGAPVAGEPNPSEHNLRALGLELCAVRANWTAPGTAWK